MTRKRKIMRSFKMNEISAVDTPAQAGAVALLMKRAEPNPYFEKASFQEALDGIKASEAVYQILDGMWDLNSALRTSIESILQDPKENPDAEKAVRESLDQYVERVVALVQANTEAIVDVVDGDAAKRNKETPMNDAEKKAAAEAAAELEKKNAELDARLAKSEKMNTMNDAQRSHYNTLSGEAQDEFLNKSAEERDAALAEISKADPVVYTADNGDTYHKSDDARLVKMAKERDTERKIAKAEREKAEKLELAKRADTELGHLPGDDDAKIAMLKAVDAIGDEDHRKAALAMLKANDSNIATAFRTAGVDKGASGDDPNTKLQSLAKARAKEDGIDENAAYMLVLDTPEGSALYAESVAANK